MAMPTLAKPLSFNAMRDRGQLGRREVLTEVYGTGYIVHGTCIYAFALGRMYMHVRARSTIVVHRAKGNCE
jgi:hypothetical protein